MNVPTVLITRGVWNRAAAEFDHFAYSQRESEACMYGMAGFVRRKDCRKRPWDMIEACDIEYIIITHIFVPPREICEHSRFRAAFQFRSADEKNGYVDTAHQWQSAALGAHPALQFCYMHSHPFAWHSTSPSSIDYARAHRLWHETCVRNNLNTPLEVIVCRSLRLGVRWKACCFGFNETQSVISFGSATIVPDDDPRVLQVLSPSYTTLPEAVEWAEREARAVTLIEITEQPQGWHTCVIQLSQEHEYLFVYLPPDFPTEHRVLYQVIKEGVWGDVVAHEWCNDLSELRFSDIVATIKG